MKLSIAMMVKNEEDNLKRCLQSLQSIRDAVPSELIIVDTGSTDKTVEIAKQYTDKVYFHQWNNDFSAMRNITINYAKGKWILIIDADEEIQNVGNLIEFLKNPHNSQYGVAAINCKNIVNDEIGGFTLMTSYRLFKNDGYFHYTGAVHNQAVFKGKEIALPEVFLLHYGYIATDATLMEKKFLRTSTILKSELEKDPNNYYYWAQLSTTYSMHNENEVAIEYIEKAYALLPPTRVPQHLFVFIQMILSYQRVKNYKKIEALCDETLTIKEGYIDIYYYLGEAKAVLQKYEEAVIYYQKYLEILQQKDVAGEKDLSIIEYTLGLEELVYYNLSNIYEKLEKYELALHYAEKITYEKYAEENIRTTIFLYIKLGKCTELRKYYDQKIKTEWQKDFFKKLDIVKNKFDKTTKLAVAQAFENVDDEYGLLCSIIVEDHNGFISTTSQEAVGKIDLAQLPIYCSDIFYYLLKWHYPLGEIIIHFKEAWVNCVCDYIANQYDDLSQKIYDYLTNATCINELSGYKLCKTLCRCALLLNKLSDVEYREIFNLYIRQGAIYLQALYSNKVIDNIMVYEMKNDEEVFLLYMLHAQNNEQKKQAEYVTYLRNALRAFPEMKKGIEMLLNDIKSAKVVSENVFDSYKVEVKTTIKQLIESGKMDEAKVILDEYKSIVSDDMEAILLESKILLH